jgi:hypothetical protein
LLTAHLEPPFVFGHVSSPPLVSLWIMHHLRIKSKFKKIILVFFEAHL